jgi:hypothetical protein
VWYHSFDSSNPKKTERTLATYDVCIKTCPECGHTHPLGVQVEMQEKPDLKRPLKGTDRPPGKMLDQHAYQCPDTKVLLKLSEDDELVLVPVGQ